MADSSSARAEIAAHHRGSCQRTELENREANRYRDSGHSEDPRREGAGNWSRPALAI